MDKRHFLTLVSVGSGAGPRISTKMFKKGVFVKHPSKKVVSFWCWCEGQLKTHCERVFFPPRTPNDWPIGTRLPQNLTLIKSCCSSSATIMATDLMGNQVVYFLLNAHCDTPSPRRPGDVQGRPASRQQQRPRFWPLPCSGLSCPSATCGYSGAGDLEEI